tara:strand:- start:9563 stop:10513 length:951 start_codon:yes stop_codon:yes gene_type:complete
MTIPHTLTSIISERQTHASLPATQCAIDQLLTHYDHAIQAILFYGSCFRESTDNGLIDLYVIVDQYTSVHDRKIKAILNRILPPNVYYLEFPLDDKTIRTKYSIVSLSDFQQGTTMQWFHSYFWGRFAQPTELVFFRNHQVKKIVQAAMAQAIMTLMARTLPYMTQDFRARDIWEKGLSLSYQAELRSERPETASRLFDAASAYYERVTHACLMAMPHHVTQHTTDSHIQYHTTIPQNVRSQNKMAWKIRKFQGKILSVLRLIKGLFTFHGGVDYILWKVERHSGITVEVTPRLRKHPLLVGWVVFWRLYRRGAFH